MLLIDEIDKADIEFPNDLLLELDRMEFHVYETGETVRAEKRPIVIITSNNEKELPDAFLRRCFFHYIKFPDEETMARIIDVHYPGIKRRLVEEALRIFFEIREAPGLKKKPSTSELLDWLKLLMAEDIGPEQLRERDPRKLIPPLHGALLKNEQDVTLFEKLAFLSRREGRTLNGTAPPASPREIVMAVGDAGRGPAVIGKGTQGRGADGGLSAGRGAAPELVLVSPARRTQETWSLVQPALGAVPMRVEPRIYDAPAARLLSMLQEIDPADRKRPGHRP